MHVPISSFYLDRVPVSNGHYARFLSETDYKPVDERHFLREWPDWKTASFPAGNETVPVTGVSLDEARSFCAWAGGRLPHAWEWQYAAQGGDGRVQPWGNASCDACWPPFTSGIVFAGPARVGAHSPQGDSPFGVGDRVGQMISKPAQMIAGKVNSVKSIAIDTYGRAGDIASEALDVVKGVRDTALVRGLVGLFHRPAEQPDARDV